MRAGILLLIVLLAIALVVATILTMGDGPATPPSGPGVEPGDEVGDGGGELEGRNARLTILVDVAGRLVRMGSLEPLARAEVEIEGVSGRSDDIGAFELPGVASGEVEITVRAEGLPDYRANLVVAPESPDLGVIEVPAGTVLTGLVTSADGVPVKGGIVRILERNRYSVGTPWSGPKLDQFKMGVAVFDRGEPYPGMTIGTGDDGRFRVAGLSPGLYHVCGKGPGLAWAERDEVEVAVGSAAEVNLVLRPGSTISGKVLDTRRQPVGGARVVVAPWNQASVLPYTPMEETVSAADGTFSASHLTPGTNYFLLARAPDGKFGIGIRVPAPTEKTEIVVGPRYIVGGTVVDDETGAPIEKAKLFALLAHTESDEQGSYRLEGVVKSAFLRWVWIEADGYEGKTHEIDLALSLLGGSEIRQDFRLTKERPGRLTVRAEDIEGSPVAGVALLVNCWEEENKVVARGATNGSGEAVIEGVPPGNVRIRAMKPGHVHVHASNRSENELGAYLAEGLWTSVPPGGETEVVVQVARVGTIRGKVVGPDGKPIAGVRIRSLEIEVGTTDAEGAFETRKVPDEIATLLNFEKKGFLPLAEWLVAGTGVEARVEMIPGATISGVVVDEKGDPVAGADVSAMVVGEEGIRERVSTSPSGAFTFSGLMAGDYLLLAERSGFAPLKTPRLALGEAATREGVRIAMSRGNAVTFFATSPAGEVVPASVLVYGPLEVERTRRILHRQGYRDLAGVEVRLLPGRYRIIVTPLTAAAGGGATEIERDVFSEGEVRIELSESGERLVIRPLLPPDTKARGMHLTRTEPEEPAASFWFEAGEDGLIETPGLPPGKYKVMIYYQGDDETSWYGEEFTDLEPGPKTVELDLRDR